MKKRKIFLNLILGLPILAVSCSSKIQNPNNNLSNAVNNPNLSNNDLKKRLERYEKAKIDLAPKGQNFAEIDPKTNKRIVRDQYLHDVPSNEMEYYLLKQGGAQTEIIGRTPEKHLRLNPKHFTPPKKEILDKLNQKAKLANQPYYENAQQRVFSLPSFDKDGNIDGLVINNYEQGFTSPAWWGDDASSGGPGRIGLPRIIANDKYKNLTASTVSLQIRNGAPSTVFNLDSNDLLQTSKSSYGTAQIIDYKLESDNNKYPLTWYFLTNMHVANSFRIYDDAKKSNDDVFGRDESNYDTRNYQSNTWDITLRRLKTNNITLKSKVPVSAGNNNEQYYESVNIKIKEKNGSFYNNGQSSDGKQYLKSNSPKSPMNVRTIVTGTDFFKSSPKDFGKNDFYKDVEEVLDFAIFEVTFDNESDAKKITEDYYKGTSQFKVSDLNLLDKKNYEALKAFNFYALGFPLSAGELSDTLNEEIDKQGYEARNSSVSVWTNKNRALFSNTDPENKLYEKGGELSWSRSYRSFVNNPGLTDYFISTPVLSTSMLSISKYNSNTKKFESTPYMFSGQGTLLDNYAAPGGSSGSPVKTEDESSYSIVFASDQRASTGLTLNLRSYGFDYKGYYGKYNLPKYDIIYGSDDNQRKSYFDAMKQIYKSDSNFKTKLFDKGFGEKIDVFKSK